MTTRPKALAALLLMMSVQSAWAEPLAVKIGVLTDMSSVFSSWSGAGSLLAARMAVEDFKQKYGDATIAPTVMSADHQNKPDIAALTARKWIQADGVDLILDVPNSAAALAVNEVVRGTKTAVMFSGPAHDGLIGDKCSPNTVLWTFDTWSLANGTGRTTVELGGKDWYFITADFAGGHALEKVVADVVTKSGGRIIGHTFPPIASSDYASFLLQAQQSKAQVVGLSMSGTDFSTALKQAQEFGLTQGGQRIAGLVVNITDVHSLGLAATKGLVFTEAFYWDLDDGKRAFAKRFAAKNNDIYPTQIQAGVYASTWHYLKAAAKLKSKDGPAVVAEMKAEPIDDPLFSPGYVRVDGRAMHNMYVFESKAPAESKGPWDYYKLLRAIPPEQAFAPVNTACNLVK